jgi:hypothetical protein
MKDYPFVRDLLDAHTVLFYHDTFTPELITAVSEAMDGAHPNKAASKKFYYILVESLQNVLRHQSDEPGLMQPFLLIRREGGRLAVTTGN